MHLFKCIIYRVVNLLFKHLSLFCRVGKQLKWNIGGRRVSCGSSSELNHQHLALEDLLYGGPHLGVGHLLGGVLHLDQAGHGVTPDVQVLTSQAGAATL